MADTKLQVVVSARDDASNVLRGVSAQTKSLGGQFSNLAKSVLPIMGIAAGIGALAAGFKSAISSAMEFEKAMSNIATLVDTSTEDIEQMGKEVQEIAKRTPVAISELTEALYDVRSAGISAGQAMDTLEASARLAVAGLGTTKEATNLLTSSINVFSSQGYSANEMANILFKTVKAGKTTVAGLARAFGMVAPLAGTLGVKLTELQAATAALTTTGMTAAIAQTQLRAGMANLMKPTKEMKELMDRIGVSTAKQLVETHGLVGGYTKLREASKGNAEMFAKAMGSVEGLNAALFLSGEGAEKFTEILADMENGVDNLTEAFEKQKATSAAQYQLFKNNLNIVMMDLGNRILPFLVKMMQWLTRAFEEVKMAVEFLINRLVKFNLWLEYVSAWITRDKEYMKALKDQMIEVDKELDTLANKWANVSEELDVMEQGIEQNTEALEEFAETAEETGEETEKAFKDAVKAIKSIRDDITKAYEDIESASSEYKKKVSSVEEDYQDDVVKLYTDTEEELKQLRENRLQAVKDEDTEEIASLDRQIAEKEAILKSYRDSNLNLNEEIAERREYLAMNEMERLEADHKKKLLMIQKEYLEDEIERHKRLISLIQEHQLALGLIDDEKKASIDAEIEKTKTFREKLQEKLEALNDWVDKAKDSYDDYATYIKGLDLAPATPGVTTGGTLTTGFVGQGATTTPATIEKSSVNNYNFDFKGAYIGDIEQFKMQIIDSINRESVLTTYAGT